VCRATIGKLNDRYSRIPNKIMEIDKKREVKP
jgi:hypothetical protein